MKKPQKLLVHFELLYPGFFEFPDLSFPGIPETPIYTNRKNKRRIVIEWSRWNL